MKTRSILAAFSFLVGMAAENTALAAPAKPAGSRSTQNTKQRAKLHDGLAELNRIENIRHTLKSEFVGMDSVIDRLVDFYKAAQTTPEMVKMPQFENWHSPPGMGKTSLFQRFVKLTGSGPVAITLTVKPGSNTEFPKDQLIKMILANQNKKKGLLAIVIIDESHNVIDETNASNGKGHWPNIKSGDEIWQMLGNGKFELVPATTADGYAAEIEVIQAETLTQLNQIRTAKNNLANIQLTLNQNKAAIEEGNKKIETARPALTALQEKLSALKIENSAETEDLKKIRNQTEINELTGQLNRLQQEEAVTTNSLIQLKQYDTQYATQVSQTAEKLRLVEQPLRTVRQKFIDKIAEIQLDNPAAIEFTAGQDLAQIADRFVEDPNQFVETFKDHARGASISPMRMVDAGRVLIIQASNPKVLNPVIEEFKRLPRDEQTPEEFNRMIETSVQKGSLAQELAGYVNPHPAWPRRLGIAEGAELWKALTTEQYREGILRGVNQRYQKMSQNLTEEYGISAPKLVLGDNVVDVIASKIINPLSGGTVFGSTMDEIVNPILGKIKLELMERAYNGKSSPRTIGLAFAKDNVLVATATGLKVQQEVRFGAQLPPTTELEAIASEERLRSARHLAGHIVTGMLEYGTVPAQATVRMAPEQISGGALWKKLGQYHWGWEAARIKMLLGGAVAERLEDGGAHLKSTTKNLEAARKLTGDLLLSHRNHEKTWGMLTTPPPPPPPKPVAPTPIIANYPDPDSDDESSSDYEPSTSSRYSGPSYSSAYGSAYGSYQGPRLSDRDRDDEDRSSGRRKKKSDDDAPPEGAEAKEEREFTEAEAKRIEQMERDAKERAASARRKAAEAKALQEKEQAAIAAAENTGASAAIMAEVEKVTSFATMSDEAKIEHVLAKAILQVEKGQEQNRALLDAITAHLVRNDSISPDQIRELARTHMQEISPSLRESILSSDPASVDKKCLVSATETFGINSELEIRSVAGKEAHQAVYNRPADGEPEGEGPVSQVFNNLTNWLGWALGPGGER